MKNKYFPSPYAELEARVASAWGEISLFLFSKQPDLAHPETQIPTETDFVAKIQAWSDAIVDLAGVNKALALENIDEALREAKSFRDMQKYNGAELLLKKVETVKRTIAMRDSGHLARYNPHHPLSFGGRPQRAGGVRPDQRPA